LTEFQLKKAEDSMKSITELFKDSTKLKQLQSTEKNKYSSGEEAMILQQIHLIHRILVHHY
jgi:hypothetical protein